MIICTQDSGFIHPDSSDITSPSLYLRRRVWLQSLTLGAGGAALAGLNVMLWR